MTKSTYEMVSPSNDNCVIVAAVDYGRKWIGIAATAGHGVVFPAGVIEQHSRRHSLEAVRQRLAELGAERVIVGWPINMDGSAGTQAVAAEKFADELRQMSGLAVDMFDERLTSYEASERLSALPRHHRRSQRVDAVAACIILESWLQNSKR
jgi:putative Holliday junction resolvase